MSANNTANTTEEQKLIREHSLPSSLRGKEIKGVKVVEQKNKRGNNEKQ